MALEALRSELTAAQLAAKHGIHQTIVGEWKRQAMEGADGSVFRQVGGTGERQGGRSGGREAAREDRAAVGGTGFFGESFRSMRLERRRQIIEPEHPQLSVVRQCELVSISRSGFYHRPAGETALNLELMRLIDARFLAPRLRRWSARGRRAGLASRPSPPRCAPRTAGAKANTA